MSLGRRTVLVMDELPESFTPDIAAHWEQGLAAAREAMVKLEDHMRVSAAGLPTEYVFGSILKEFCSGGLPLENVLWIAAAAVIDRIRPADAIELPPV